jgi:CheY-like chemotaxis protein
MKKKRLLLLDDENQFAESIKNYILEKSDVVTVTTSIDCESAHKIVEKEMIDLVILDLNMPDMDCLQFLHKLQRQKVWIPVIILSGIPEEELISHKKTFLDYGIVDFFEKPVNLEDLDKRIEEVLEKFDAPPVLINENEALKKLSMFKNKKKSGILTIYLEDAFGRFFFKNGKILDAKIRKPSDKNSFDKILTNITENKDIRVKYINQNQIEQVNLSTRQLTMETVWEKVDSQRVHVDDQNSTPNFEANKTDNLANIANSLNTLKELESYVITDVYGRTYSSSDKINERLVSTIINVFVIGGKVGEIMKIGNPLVISYFKKSGRIMVVKHNDYLIILVVKATTKLPAFKKKLNQIVSPF